MALKLVFVLQVVCSTCKHVSVTYEPFMYLSVPLPHAMERQICKLNHCILNKLSIRKYFVIVDKMIGCLWVNYCVIINLINIFIVNVEDAVLFFTRYFVLVHSLIFHLCLPYCLFKKKKNLCSCCTLGGILKLSEQLLD